MKHKKLPKKLRAQMHRYIVDQMSEFVLAHFREALKLEGFHKNIRVRKDGKIVVDASKISAKNKVAERKKRK